MADNVTAEKPHWWMLHHWGRWIDVERGEIQQQHFGETIYVPVGSYVRQERVCQACGKRQMREARTR
jgi:hypothetical protein